MRNRRTNFLLGTLLIGVVGVAGPSAASRFRCARLPAIFTKHGHFLTQAEVGGIQGWYLVDTASARTVVTPNVATRLQATGKSVAVTSGGRSGNEPFQAVRVLSGAVRFASWGLRYPEEVIVVDLQPLTTRLERELDGLLGWDVLREYVLGFDAREKRFLGGKTVAATELLERIGIQETATVLPLGLLHDVPFITGGSENEELKLILDTGCGLTVLTDTAWDGLQGQSLEGAPEKVVWTIDGETSGRVAKRPELRLGPIRLTDIPVMVKSAGPDPAGSEGLLTKVDGILGIDVLSKYLVVLDGPRRVLYLAERTGE